MLTKGYLFAYNVSQLAGWCYLMFVALPHYKIFLTTGRTPKHMYADIALTLKLLLLMPYMEVVHALLGMVRSNPFQTFVQVTGRAFVLIGVCDRFDCTHETVHLSLMVIAWNVSEITRYAYYAHNVLGFSIGILTWLRYTLFIILYPIGAGSEFLCMMKALPDIKTSQVSSISMPNNLNITFSFYYLVTILMLLYVPLFPQLYGHMLKQRKKILNAPTPEEEKKQN